MAYYIIEDECNGCTSCANICPTGAASGEKKEPHRIDEAVCIECGACGKLCPQDAVRDPSGQVPQRLKRKQWEKPSPWKLKKCTAGAVSLIRHTISTGN